MMPRRQFTSPHLSDHAGCKICVVCPCGMTRRYDADQMLRRIEDQPMPSLLLKIARAEGCKKVDNDFQDRCRLHYDIEFMMAQQAALNAK